MTSGADGLKLFDRLSAVPLFHGLQGQVVERLARTAKHRNATRRECFFNEGQEAKDLFVLMSGRVKISQHTADGGQFVMSLVAANEPFGVLCASGGRRYSTTAEAIEGSLAVVWPRVAIRQLFEHESQFALNALDIVSARLQELDLHFRQVVMERVDRRVARVLLRLVREAGRRIDGGGVEIDFAVSRQDIAEMTGTTMFTVSRLLVAWGRRGIVRVGRQRIVVVEAGTLATIADPEDPPEQVVAR